MKFSEAMAALEEGKKVRCKHWAKDEYIDVNRAGAMIALPCKDEWEIYEEPEKLLTFVEVVKGLKEGKRFRRRFWANEYAIIPGDQILEFKEQSGDFEITLRLKDFETTDWVQVR